MTLDAARHPIVAAHRGASATHPENTLGAFLAAQDDGAEAVELDVRLTADGVLVVIHDATLDRTTDGRGPVAAQPMAQLRTLRGPDDAVIPTLEDVAERVTLPLLVEVKSDDAAPVLGRLLAADAGLAARVRVMSFHAGQLRAVAQHAPDVPRILVTRWAGRLATGRARSLGAGAVNAFWPSVTPGTVRRARGLGVETLAWGLRPASAPDDATRTVVRAHRLGLDALVVDDPGPVRAARDALLDGRA